MVAIRPSSQPEKSTDWPCFTLYPLGPLSVYSLLYFYLLPLIIVHLLSPTDTLPTSWASGLYLFQ